MKAPMRQECSIADLLDIIDSGVVVEMPDASYLKDRYCMGDLATVGRAKRLRSTSRTESMTCWEWLGPGKVTCSGKTLSPGDLTEWSEFEPN